MAGERLIHQGPHTNQIRVPDDELEYLRRCDRLISDARGDAPLRAFWRGVKCEYLAGLSGRDESANPVCLVAMEEGPDILVGRDPVIVGRDPWCDARLALPVRRQSRRQSRRPRPR